MSKSVRKVRKPNVTSEVWNIIKEVYLEPVTNSYFVMRKIYTNDNQPA